MHVHLVEKDTVVNTVEVSSVAVAQHLFPDRVCVEAKAGSVGWRFDGETFTAPSAQVPIPQSVTMRQARLALLAAGLLDTAEAVIAGIPGDVGRAARIEWEYAQEVRRDNALLQQVQALAGFSDQDVDSLFLSAAAL